MQVRARYPGPASTRPGANTDLRTTITFQDESLPLPLRVHFVIVGDDETGEREYRNVGFELGETPKDEETALALPELTAVTLRRVVERYPHWVELARAYAAVDCEQAGGLTSAAKRAKPARLDRDWYRMIAAEYRRHVAEDEPAPITVIAKSHGVTPSAASRWVKAARDKGLLQEEGITDAS
jgi:hypothetical protein